jgi:hypothetical protein
MKKIFFLLLIAVFAFSNQFISRGDYFVNNLEVNKFYNLENAYYQTKGLISLIEKMLNNDKFIKYSEFSEMAKTRVYTSDLLKKLLVFLKGNTPFSNTEFDVSSKRGVEGILEDLIQNRFLNIPQNVKQRIVNSIKNEDFFKLKGKIENELRSLNKDNIKEVILNFNALFDCYFKNLKKIHSKLFENFNDRIKEELLKKYRIYAKTSLIKIFEIFKKYLNQNAKIYQ